MAGELKRRVCGGCGEEGCIDAATVSFSFVSTVLATAHDDFAEV